MKISPVVTIFGSSRIDENYPEYQKAVLVGRMLADAGFVICNGGYGGIMEASARGAKEAGGKTIGIITDEFPSKPNRWVDEVQTTKTWRERLFALIETGDAFVLFNGGTGTLVELFVAWEMINKKMIQKPLIVFGAAMRSLVSRLKKERYVVSTPCLKIAKTVQEVLDHLYEAF